MSLVSPARVGSLRFILVKEHGPGNFVTEAFEDEVQARRAADESWASFVLFASNPLRELRSGGLGFGHRAIREFAELNLSAHPIGPAAAPTYVSAQPPAAADGTAAVNPATDPTAAAETDAHDKVRAVVSQWSGLQSGPELSDPLLDPQLADPLLAAVEQQGRSREGAAADVPTEVQAESVPGAEAEPRSEPEPEEARMGEARPAGEGGAVSGQAAPSAGSSLGTPWYTSALRRRLSKALTCPDRGKGVERKSEAAADAACGVALVAVVREAAGGPSASGDALLDNLVALFSAEPPSDAEMSRLRRLKEREDTGMVGYSVATAWLAALYTRTEACIRARSRLTATLLSLEPAAKRGVFRAATRLVEGPLTSLLERLAEQRALVSRLLSEVGIQEVAVRSSKGVSAGLAIAGTVLAFTPAMPVGVGAPAKTPPSPPFPDPTLPWPHPSLTPPFPDSGLMLGGAGIGVTTSTGDAIGTHVQKVALRKSLTELGEAEISCCAQLEKLVADFFPKVPVEEWEAARGAGLLGSQVELGSVANSAVQGGAAMATGAAMTAGLRIAVTRGFALLGAVGLSASSLTWAAGSLDVARLGSGDCAWHALLGRHSRQPTLCTRC